MHGNVWEWTRDGWQDKLLGGADPLGATTASNRVYRGGSWRDWAANCRSAFRYGYSLSGRGIYLGFRLAAAQSPR